MKKLTIKSLLFTLLLVLPIFSFAAISEQNKVSFKNMYGNEIKPETYTNILNFCDANDTNINSCLEKLKAKVSDHKSIQNQTSYKLCCLNRAGFLGEYAYIQGQEYCIPPC